MLTGNLFVHGEAIDSTTTGIKRSNIKCNKMRKRDKGRKHVKRQTITDINMKKLCQSEKKQSRLLTIKVLVLSTLPYRHEHMDLWELICVAVVVPGD